MASNSKLYYKKWEFKRKRLKYHLKNKNTNNLPRLVIFRSNKNIFTQLIDDIKNKTILSVSSIDKNIQGDINKAKNKIEKSVIVGNALAEKMKKANIAQVIFDRNGYKYHGRVKALCDAVRKKEITI